MSMTAIAGEHSPVAIFPITSIAFNGLMKIATGE